MDADAVADVLASLAADAGDGGGEWWAALLCDDLALDDTADAANPFLDAAESQSAQVEPAQGQSNAEPAQGQSNAEPAQPQSERRAGPAEPAPRRAHLRVDSRRLARAPRTSNTAFQASLRHSMRRISAAGSSSKSSDFSEMNLPNIQIEQVEGVAKVLDVLSRAQKEQVTAGSSSWLDALAEEENESDSQPQSPRKNVDSIKFLKALRSSLHNRRGTASRPKTSAALAAPLSPSNPPQSLDDSLAALAAAEEELAALDLPPTSPPPSQQPKPTPEAPTQPSPGADDTQSGVARQRSTVITHAGRRAADTDTGFRAHGKRDEALKLYNKVAQLDAGDYSPFRSRRLRDSVRAGQLSSSSAEAAAKWASKELQKLLDVIRAHGRKSPASGFTEISFGVLYEKTIDVFDAADVDSVLDTARSLGLVLYEGMYLSPRANHGTTIVLLSETVPEGADNYSYKHVQRLSVRRAPRSSASSSAADDEERLAPEDRKLSYSVRR